MAPGKGLNGFKFAELNLRHAGDVQNTANLVIRAIRMGYDAVAINIDVGDPFNDRTNQLLLETEDEPVPKKKKKGNKGGKECMIIPDPFKLPTSYLPEADLKRFENDGRQFRQFSRITVTLTDSTSIYRLITHPKIKLYDIVAVRLSDVEMLNTLARKGDFVDIVTFDACSSMKPSWLFSAKMIQAVTAEGIGFELTYGKALIDGASRRQFFTNGRLLMDGTRNGHNVFFASGTTEYINIRGPYDVANMTSLIGLDSYKGIHLISNTPKNLLLRCQARSMTVKGAICVSNLDSIPSRNLDSKEALEELMKIDEFKKQVRVADETEENAESMSMEH